MPGFHFGIPGDPLTMTIAIDLERVEQHRLSLIKHRDDVTAHALVTIPMTGPAVLNQTAEGFGLIGRRTQSLVSNLAAFESALNDWVTNMVGTDGLIEESLDQIAHQAFR